MSKKSWLFFDVGETLVDETRSYDLFFEACSVALKEEGKMISPEAYRERVEAQYKINGHRPLYTVWQSFDSRLPRPKWKHQQELLYPETKETLAYLSTDYYLGIIANQGIGLRERLEELGIVNYFDYILASSDAGIKKPQLGFFERGLNDVGALPQETYYIGDRVDNDMIPAKKIGMRTIRVKQGMGQWHHEDKEYPSDWIIHNLSELKQIFPRI